MKFSKITISQNTFNKIKDFLNLENAVKYGNKYFTNNGLEIIIKDK